MNLHWATILLPPAGRGLSGGLPQPAFETAADGDPDPKSAGTAGDAALWGGSSAAVGMAANRSEPTRSAVIGPTEWLVGRQP